MKKHLAAIAAIPAALILGAALIAEPSAADGPDREGYSEHHGHHMGGGYGMMGPGMMGPGMGYGMMGHGGYGYGYGVGPCATEQSTADKDLGVDDVTKMLQFRLDHWGNPRLKVGKVEIKNDDVIVAEIVTRDGALVDRIAIDRDSGRQRRVE